MIIYSLNSNKNQSMLGSRDGRPVHYVRVLLLGSDLVGGRVVDIHSCLSPQSTHKNMQKGHECVF